METLDAVTEGPAFVRNGRMDLLAANRLARAFYAQVYADPQSPANLARFTFLDDNAHRFYPDWDSAADICVAILRTEAGRDPRDKDLHDLVGELSTRSTEFRTHWGSHNVRHHGTGAKTFHHHIVGNLTSTACKARESSSVVTSNRRRSSRGCSVRLLGHEHPQR